MFYSSNDIKYGIFFNFLINYIYPIMILFYPINIKNKENIYKDVNKSCIYISRHTLHNYELLLGLFTLNQHSPKFDKEIHKNSDIKNKNDTEIKRFAIRSKSLTKLIDN